MHVVDRGFSFYSSDHSQDEANVLEPFGRELYVQGSMPTQYRYEIQARECQMYVRIQEKSKLQA